MDAELDEYAMDDTADSPATDDYEAAYTTPTAAAQAEAAQARGDPEGAPAHAVPVDDAVDVGDATEASAPSEAPSPPADKEPVAEAAAEAEPVAAEPEPPSVEAAVESEAVAAEAPAEPESLPATAAAPAAKPGGDEGETDRPDTAAAEPERPLTAPAADDDETSPPVVPLSPAVALTEEVARAEAELANEQAAVRAEADELDEHERREQAESDALELRAAAAAAQEQVALSLSRPTTTGLREAGFVQSKVEQLAETVEEATISADALPKEALEMAVAEPVAEPVAEVLAEAEEETGGGLASRTRTIPKAASTSRMHVPRAAVSGSASMQSLYSTSKRGHKGVSPSFGFGTASRAQAGKLSTPNPAGMESPGPTRYNLPSSIGGKQPDGRKKDPPVWSQAKAGRFVHGYGKSEARPGPTAYNLPAVVGASDNPQATAEPKWRFGTSTREQGRKVYVSQQHTLTEVAGKLSPGPAKYQLPTALGRKQPNGRIQDRPQWTLKGRERIPYAPVGSNLSPHLLHVDSNLSPHPPRVLHIIVLFVLCNV